MNEILFMAHVFCMLGFALVALKMGKEVLTAFVSLSALLANLFVLKQIECFGLVITCTDVFAVGGILGLNLLQEYFGKETSMKAGWICFFLLTFFALMSHFQLIYAPSHLDATHGAYSTLLSPAPRLLLASLFTFFLVQQFDIRFFAFLKRALPKAPLFARNGCSLILSQLFDTTLFSFLGLYGLISPLSHVILFSFLIKCLIILSMTPLITFSKYLSPKVSS